MPATIAHHYLTISFQDVKVVNTISSVLFCSSGVVRCPFVNVFEFDVVWCGVVCLTLRDGLTQAGGQECLLSFTMERVVY